MTEKEFKKVIKVIKFHQEIGKGICCRYEHNEFKVLHIDNRNKHTIRLRRLKEDPIDLNYKDLSYLRQIDLCETLYYYVNRSSLTREISIRDLKRRSNDN